MIVLGRERSITMDDIKKLYIDEDLTNKGVMDFFNTSLRANRFGMTTTDLDTHFQQGKKAERSALLDFAGMYAAAGLIANYNASGSNFSNVPEGQFKGSNLDKPKVGGGNESKVPRTGEEWNQYFKEKYGAENVTWETAPKSVSEVITAPQKVIGHYPEYVELSKKLNTKPFSVPDNIWNKMTSDEQWAANQKFLDRAISKGTEFNLATPIDKVRPESYLQKEIEYLMSQGYKLSSDGTKLIK
ncbi:hypothetical protein RBG61_00495 [Paludicola sp. MB14-C6]|uniref:hypothetical protein n=1 Tax=Paludihabitans sp. MB14-C6 TaxID=3070656 RepID=UPI0027DBC4F2|nr:hypothetical protein [Paludicola sp. MB14-C6]WMJ23169.1 hypothetical protein RBG61_00495 [Paludicola sp. MB14-C6]